MNRNCLIFAFLFNFLINSVLSADTFSAAKHVIYEMYSRASPDHTNLTLDQIQNQFDVEDNDTPGRSLSLNDGLNFDPNRPTRIFIHGYYSDRETFAQYADAYLKAGDFNFIAINWLAGAITVNYMKARYRVREVGEAVAQFIDHLVTLGLNLNDLILVGHSLGAHVCGIAGKHIDSGKPAVIIGLDPALPLFNLKNPAHRLTYTDAHYVQIIHTSGGFLGVKHPIGHADFYPNYGCVQPGCSGLLTEVCSHTRVHDLFLETLEKSSQFWSMKCASYDEICKHKCSEAGASALMGGDKENMEKAFGLYYLDTNDKTPYSLYHYITR